MVLLFARPSAGEVSVECPGQACNGEEQDEAGMLQRSRHSTRGRRTRPPSSSSTLALALDGGGWTAFVVQMGFVVGLGVASAKEAGIAEPTLESSGILDNINIISSVSGGSWFAAELIYSARFKQLVDQMLAEPSRIRELFQAEWVAPYMEFLKSTHNILQDLFEVGSFSGSDVTQISTTAGILGRALDERRSWSDVIIYFLQLTASISPALTLSDQANSWAQNKTWLACNSLAVPPQEAPAWPFVSHPFGTNNYRYWGNSGGAEPEVAVIPSKISWRIGGTQSPFPFVASGALGPKTTLAWEGTTRDFFKSHWISNTAPLDFGALEQGR